MSKVKLLNLLVVLALVLSYPLSSGMMSAQAAPVSSEIASEFIPQEQPVQALALPTIYDFESGMPSGYFADPGGAIAASVVTTATLGQTGVITNHVLAVSVVTPRAWAGLQGFNLAATQDWSAYDGVSFWFKGTNSGKTFLYVITQGGGAGLYQAPFTDNITAGNCQPPGRRSPIGRATGHRPLA
jgi:beta-glucosidase